MGQGFGRPARNRGSASGGSSASLDEAEAHAAQLATAISSGNTELWGAINALEQQIAIVERQAGAISDLALQAQAKHPKLPPLEQAAASTANSTATTTIPTSSKTTSPPSAATPAVAAAVPGRKSDKAHKLPMSGSQESQLLQSWLAPLPVGKKASKGNNGPPSSTPAAAPSLSLGEASGSMSLPSSGERHTLPKNLHLAGGNAQWEAQAGSNTGSGATGATAASGRSSVSSENGAASSGSPEDGSEDEREPYRRYLAEAGRIEYFSPARDVVVTRTDDEGFGLSIVAAQTKGSVPNPDRALFISKVKKGGAAERGGALAAHDRLLAVNGIDVTLGDHEQVVGLIRGSGRQVTLSVASRLKVKRARASDTGADTATVLMAAINAAE